jgi:hypothetical protein
MYEYTLELTPAKKYKDMNYENYANIFYESCKYINKGLSFTRDGKELSITEVSTDKLVVLLKSKNSLQNPARSISALTRFLTSNYSDIFKNYIYNKTLFSMKLIDSKTANATSAKEMTNEEMLKTIIDLLYAHTAISVSDTQNRIKTIERIKELVEPYYNK